MTYDPTSVLHDPKVKFVAGIIIKRTYFDIQQRMFALKREERKTSQNNMLADITIKFRSIIIIQQSTCSQCFLTKHKKIQHGGRPNRKQSECAMNACSSWQHYLFNLQLQDRLLQCQKIYTLFHDFGFLKF